MKVTLLNSNYDEKLADVAAAMCVGTHEASLRTEVYHSLYPAIKSGHYSVLEHLPLTWIIEDISRACSHQLVRHRIASHSQLSQRYAKIGSGVYDQWYVVPDSLYKQGYADDYYEFMNTIKDFYNKLLGADVPKEDARMVLPNACFTSLMITMNARSFIEASTLRTCNRAQWEIRELFTRMRESIKEVYPIVYELCFPNCTKKCGCLEAKSCGKPYKKRSV